METICFSVKPDTFDPFTEFSIEIYPCNYVRFTFVEIEEPIGKIKNRSSKERLIMNKKYVIYSKLGEDYSENRIADFLKGIAILMFCGSIIVGFVMAIQEISYDEKIFIWYVALIWWASGLLSSTLILGFSEIINLLHKIRLQKYIVILASQEEITRRKIK